MGAGIGPSKVKLLKLDSLSLSVYETDFKKFLSFPIKIMAINLQNGGSNVFCLKRSSLS